jgi:hypothetical protein
MRYVILFLLAVLSVITSCSHEPFEPKSDGEDTADHRRPNEKLAGTYIGQMKYFQNSRYLDSNVYVDTHFDTTYPYKIVIAVIDTNQIAFGSHIFDLDLDKSSEGYYYISLDFHSHTRFKFLSNDSIDYESWRYNGYAGEYSSWTYRFIGVKQ